jgi:drug/metabolite transporter (DMT)-like permease
MGAAARLRGYGLRRTGPVLVATMYAPADRLGAAQYSQILWALAIGALFFDEWPDALALLGIVIVVAAGLFIFAREQTLKRGQPQALPPEERDQPDAAVASTLR